jgi:hypothetical protein
MIVNARAMIGAISYRRLTISASTSKPLAGSRRVIGDF